MLSEQTMYGSQYLLMRNSGCLLLISQWTLVLDSCYYLLVDYGLLHLFPGGLWIVAVIP